MDRLWQSLILLLEIDEADSEGIALKKAMIKSLKKGESAPILICMSKKAKHLKEDDLIAKIAIRMVELTFKGYLGTL